MRPQHIFYPVLAAISLALCLAPSLARGEETEDTIGLFSAFQETSSSASRAPKPLSQTAENVTVITAREIAALNAHTLSDVLETIPGIAVQQLGSPGSTASSFIQGASPFSTQVLLDGARLNRPTGFADIGMVPARIIERIEIVKGTASSTWGQALGGVINVITKTPEKRVIGGSVSASIGEATTADTGAELSGSSGRLGYYLSGGYLGSNGLLKERHLFSNNVYGKLTYDLPNQGQLWGTVNYRRAFEGTNFTTLLGFKETFDKYYLYTTLGLRQPLTDRLELELYGHYTGRDLQSTTFDLNEDGSIIPPQDDPFFFHGSSRDRVGGGSAKLTWRGDHQLLVGGFEYEHEGYSTTDLVRNTNTLDRKTDRFGFFLNDTISLGPLTIIPGARFDKTAVGNQFSPSLGATLQVSDNNLLRVYAGKGYSFAFLSNNVGLAALKIWTVQLGLESSALPYVWLKGTLFRNETTNVLDDRNLDSTIPERRIALGAEIEARTVPVFNTSLGAGYTFVDTTRSSDDSQVKSIPRHILQLALRYDDQTFRGVLTGRHIFWNHVREPVSFNGSYYGLIWDLHLGATLLKRDNSSLEIFFSGHNLFNGAQYPDEVQPNTGRWFEGGMRVRF